jgi:chemotaxis response regulator CheB
MASESARELEADIEATRARLYGTIDRIQNRLTVAGIVDEVMGSAGVPRYQNGHDFVLGVMRKHPLPVMIAAAGLGYLFYRMNRQRAATTTIADVDYVEVPAINDGQARMYDPDLPRTHHTDVIEGRWPNGAQA